jgi:hypothetical protein
MFRSRVALELENIVLRHQIGVLKRSTGKRPKLTAADRLFWVFLSRAWPKSWMTAYSDSTLRKTTRLVESSMRVDHEAPSVGAIPGVAEGYFLRM